MPLGSIASAIGGIFSSNKAAKASKHAVASQVSEAQKARNYNKAEALKARRFARAESKAAKLFTHQQRNASQRYSTNERIAAQEWARKMDKTAVQRRVADAVAAGIHPLYALGASANYSPSFSSPGFAGASGASSGAASTGIAPIEGQTATGSVAGDAIAGVGSVAQALLERYMPPDPETQARIRALTAQGDRDYAEASLANSRRYLEGLRALSTGSGRGGKTAAQVEAQMSGPEPLQSPYGTTQPGSWSPAEAWEEQFGGLTGDAAGLLHWLDTKGAQLGRWLAPEPKPLPPTRKPHRVYRGR